MGRKGRLWGPGTRQELSCPPLNPVWNQLNEWVELRPQVCLGGAGGGTTSGFALCKYSSFDETKGPNMTLYPPPPLGAWSRWFPAAAAEKAAFCAVISVGTANCFDWALSKVAAQRGGRLISGGRPRRRCS